MIRLLQPPPPSLFWAVISPRAPRVRQGSLAFLSYVGTGNGRDTMAVCIPSAAVRGPSIIFSEMQRVMNGYLPRGTAYCAYLPTYLAAATTPAVFRDEHGIVRFIRLVKLPLL